jgi:transposase-like protein
MSRKSSDDNLTNETNLDGDADEKTILRRKLAGMLKGRRRIDSEKLRAMTELVLKTTEKSQSDVARDLDVNPSAITRAKREAATRREQLQIRILQHLTGARVQKEVRYVIDLNPSDQDSQ